MAPALHHASSYQTVIATFVLAALTPRSLADEPDDVRCQTEAKQLLDLGFVPVLVYSVSSDKPGALEVVMDKDPQRIAAGHANAQGVMVHGSLGWYQPDSLPLSEDSVFVNVGAEGTRVLVDSVPLVRGQYALFSRQNVFSNVSFEALQRRGSAVRRKKSESEPKMKEVEPVEPSPRAPREPAPTPRPAPPASKWPRLQRRVVSGRNSLTIINNRTTATVVGLRTGGSLGVDVRVPGGEHNTVNLPDGGYEVFLRFADDEQDVYQGDPISLHGATGSLTIQAGHNNYRVRKL